MSAAIKLLLPVGLGIGALFAFGKKANAAQPSGGITTPPAGGGGLTFPPLTTTPGTPSGTTPGTTPASSLPGANLPAVPDAILTRMVAALATGDPKAIRAEADKLEAEGWKAQAADLRAAARLLEQGLPGNTTAPSTSTPSTSVPPLTTTLPAPTLPAPGASTTLPPFVVTGVSDQQRRLVAGQAAIEAAKPKGRENKAKILAFQKQEQELGNYKGYKLDGKYGPATGALFIPLGMVPPKPMYWGQLNWTEAQLRAEKNAWKSRMHAEAMKDPQRADEWKRAGAVI